MRIWRFLDTGHLSGALNMAVDEILLERHERGDGPPTLRVYQWQPSAVSLGRFQKTRFLDSDGCRRLGIDVVRRVTGGRAVLHKGDLTYSVIAGTRDGVPQSVEAAYRLVCRGLLAAFRLLGVEADHGRETVRAAQPDICFMRAAVSDISHGGKKFVGSAQAWRGTSLLQHGSIVLEPQNEVWLSILAPGSASREDLEDRLAARTVSLSEILGRPIAAEEMAKALLQGMAEGLGVEFAASDLSRDEMALAGMRAHRLDNVHPAAAV